MKLADLVKACGEITSVKQAIRHKKEMGIFTDADDKFLADHEAKVVTLKEKLAKTLLSIPKNGSVIIKEGEDDASEVEEFFTSILQEGDNLKANLELVKAMLAKVPLDYPTMCEDRAIISEAAADGNLEFMELLLNVPNVRFDAMDLITTCLYNQIYRIPVTLKLMKHEPQLNLPEILDEVKDMFQEFVGDICSKKKAVQREIRTGRLELVELLLTHKLLDLDPDYEGTDCQTIFSRAAHDDDTDVMALLIGIKKVANINRAQGDRTTALQQAVLGNSINAVMMLILQKGIDLDYECDDGSAMTLATALQRDPAIIMALKSHGAKEGVRTPGCKMPPVDKQPTPAAPNAIGLPNSAKPAAAAAAQKPEPAPKPEPAAKPEPQTARQNGTSPSHTGLTKATSSAALKPSGTTGKAASPASARGKKAPTSLKQPTPPAGKAPSARGRRPSSPQAPNSSMSVSFSAAPPHPTTSRKTVAIIESSPSPMPSLPADAPKSFRMNLPLAIGFFKNWVASALDKRRQRKKQLVFRLISYSEDPRALQRLFFRDWMQATYHSKLLKVMKKIRTSLIAKYNKGAPTGGKKQLMSHKSMKNMKAAANSASQQASGGYTIMDLVEVIKLQKLSVESMVSMGVFSDEEEKKKTEAEKTIEEHKTMLVTDLTEKYKKKRTKFEPAPDETDAFETLVDDLITELDTVSCNANLFRLILETVKMDWPSICEAKGLLSMACCDGSLEYMQALLSYPHIKFDVVDAVLSAMYNQTYRIPATSLLLRHEHVLKLPEHIDELQKPFEDFVAEIASQKRALQREVRTGRLQLIEKIMTHKVIKVDPDAEGDDSQTVFSRAAHEGDHELIALLLKIKRAPDVNRIQSDKSTALIQAVFSNSVPTVALLLMQPGINVNYISPEGTALTIGIALHRDLGIIQKLKSLGGKKDALPAISKESVPRNGTDSPGRNSLRLETMLNPDENGGESKDGDAMLLPPVSGRKQQSIVVPVSISDAKKKAADSKAPTEKKKQIKSAGTGEKTVVKKKF